MVQDPNFREGDVVLHITNPNVPFVVTNVLVGQMYDYECARVNDEGKKEEVRFYEHEITLSVGKDEI